MQVADENHILMKYTNVTRNFLNITSCQAYIRFIGAILIVAFLALWHVRVNGTLSLISLSSLIFIVFLCFIYGYLFLAATTDVVKNNIGVPFQFLCGFFTFNTLLYAMTLASPFGIIANIFILFFVAVIAIGLIKKRRHSIDKAYDELPGLLAIFTSGTAATFWCGDAHDPLLIQGQMAIFQTWQDTFIHAREISVFAQAHGISTIFDIKLAGVPAPIYHFASYLSAAAISVLAGVSAIDTYSSFQLPFGIFLTGLAAFSLISSIFCLWAGLAATIAVVLLPDAYQQGFGNRYLSYNFLAQVNLGMLYGIACIAMAWIFVFNGCRRGKFLPILLGYVFLVMCIFYKAHIFVANCFLMMIYPIFFLENIPTRRRVLAGIASMALFILVVGYSQTINRVPILRLDGSGIGRYVMILLSDYDAGIIKNFFTKTFTLEHHKKPVEALYAMAMLLISTFGIWNAATIAAIMMGKSRMAPQIIFFPVLIIANYLVMTMGLALDTRSIGTPDELLNRPLVWAYFAIAAWAAGAIYHVTIGNRLQNHKMAIAGMLGFLCLALAIPIFLSHNLQTFPTRNGYAEYSQFNSVPLCLVKGAKYIRDNSDSDEIIIDSDNDPRFIVTALSERQIFIGRGIFGGHAKEQQERLENLNTFTRLKNVRDIKKFAASRNISWYVMNPGAVISWPVEFLEDVKFKCGDYRIYHFAK